MRGGGRREGGHTQPHGSTLITHTRTHTHTHTHTHTYLSDQIVPPLLNLREFLVHVPLGLTLGLHTGQDGVAMVNQVQDLRLLHRYLLLQVLGEGEWCSVGV